MQLMTEHDNEQIAIPIGAAMLHIPTRALIDTLTRLQQPPSAQAEPTIDINIKIAVPANWSNRLDMQWIVEREIHADRWSWSYAAPQAMNTQADAIEALRELVAAHGAQALDAVLNSADQIGAATSWSKRRDKAWRTARAVLAAQGGKE